MNKNLPQNEDELDEIEDEIKEKDGEEEKTHHKVSGKSVFEIKKIIQDKGKRQIDK